MRAALTEWLVDLGWRGLTRLSAIGVTVVIAACLLLRTTANADVLTVSRAIPNGGGYCPPNETGVSRDISFNGLRVLARSKSGGSYCCGFTFDVAMRVAEQRGLLRDLEPHDVSNLQREWYGTTPTSKVKQLVYAMERLSIGYEVDPGDARPGDFVVFSRPGSGHSVVFLDWVYGADGIRVGFTYRSSQPTTNGVGDETEYFLTSGRSQATVIPKYFFVGRMR